MSNNRRKFIQQASGLAGIALLPSSFYACASIMTSNNPNAADTRNSFFEISLAQWSLHKALQSKKIDNLDFPVLTKKEFGISAVEYVNTFFKDKAQDTAYLNELLKRCSDHGVKNHLIMCDGEGDLGELNTAKRLQAVDNHKKWVEAAKYLGCRSIRVNARGVGRAEEVQKAAMDGLSLLGEYAAKANINVIVENHGGYSSNGLWISTIMKNIGKKNVGTLPDFNNFCITKDSKNICVDEYDKYKGTTEMMAYAKAVSAKSMDFDAQGNCIETDYTRMLKIVKDAGFKGYIGIEYEGDLIGEYEGIMKTKALLERVRTSMI